ncbi:unnamed protein product [Euphydryas editha]|uniref:TIL domain-containing protein n=1 Tax=Euphydryas editha TaxID=104508 RepID=A0AAU9U540_EUPED|nr:unnamed protein product [Euphydryas editha]
MSNLAKCKGKCPANEEYLLCGSACPANCTNPSPVACSDDCIEGCFCLTGYLRNENGTCVNIDKCVTVPTCGENEEFLPCGTACPATCADPEPEVCGLTCSMGCFCKEGYYRDEISNKCVTPDKCPVDTSFCFNENEVFDVCNASCEPSCTDPEPVCTKVCASGCICATGLLRSPEGDCVSVDKCSVNGTAPGVLTKYLNTINKILHLTVA